jgi:hypothetical protein
MVAWPGAFEFALSEHEVSISWKRYVGLAVLTRVVALTRPPRSAFVVRRALSPRRTTLKENIA